MPFKFPPTYTFVFRAFTSLDGIGKGLNSNYDLTRLAQPFLKELVDLRDGDATVTALKTWGKKTGLRPVDLGHVVTQPRKVANMESILTRMEQGDLKIRVRDLQTEQSFKRMNMVQEHGIWFGCFYCLKSRGTADGYHTCRKDVSSRTSSHSLSVFWLPMAVGMLKIVALDKKLQSFDNKNCKSRESASRSPSAHCRHPETYSLS